MPRIDDLRTALTLMWDSMLAADDDKRAPLMNQWRALEATIAELDGKAVKVGDPVDEIAARRSTRGGATSRLGRAQRSSS